MIEGLRYDLRTAELQTILDAQIATAQQDLSKAEARRQIAENMEASNSLAGDCQRRVEDAEATIARLTLLRAHLIPNETYRLTHEDLREIGVIKRW